jgi:hypothetical protein
MIKFLFLIIPTIFLIFTGVCCASSTKQKTEQETYGEEMQFMEKNYVQTFYDDFSGTKLDTKKWNKSLNARAITIEDIEKILDIKFEQKSLYLETKNQTKPTSYENYNWLYNNTNGCTSYKCEKEDTETLGYWTSNTKINNEQATIYAWVIKYDGSLVYEKKFLASRYGIRPVIDVSKNIIK